MIRLSEDPHAVVARLAAQPAKRWFGIGSLGLLGLLLLAIAFTTPPAELGWQVFLIAFGVGCLALADKMRRATEAVLELTPQELRVVDGPVLCRLDDVRKVDRGVFAFKPSNGFVVFCTKRQPRLWAPGLYWRVGKRVGVGGVTSATEGKAFADVMTTILIEQGRGPL